MMGQAGVELWVLTGDEQETAMEMGHLTNVLTENMQPGIVEIVKAPEEEVHTRMAMAFLKLVKQTKIPECQMCPMHYSND